MNGNVSSVPVFSPSRFSLPVFSIQEWEQGRRKPEPAVRAYMLVIKNQPAAVRKALEAA
jgi:putative transcriptional regulator